MLLPLLLGQGTAGPVTHDTSGALTGPDSSVAGSAARVGASVSHATSGTLAGQLGSVVGAASNFTPHATSGVLAGPGASLAGASTNFRAFATSGALTGQGSAVTGAALYSRKHTTDGVLSGSNAIIVGSADVQPFAAPVHDTSGALEGSGAVIVGEADPVVPPQFVLQVGEGMMGFRQRKKEREDREELRKLIERTVNPIQAPAAKVVTVKDKITVIPEGGDSVSFPIPPSFDPRNVARMVVRHLERMGVEAQRTRQAQARAQARIVIERIRVENEHRLRKRRRDEEILLLM